MIVVIHKTWREVQAMIDNLTQELQDWYEYSEEVGYEPDVTQAMLDAIEALSKLLPSN